MIERRRLGGGGEKMQIGADDYQMGRKRGLLFEQGCKFI
jgi:hypothetical protein